MRIGIQSIRLSVSLGLQLERVYLWRPGRPQDQRRVIRCEPAPPIRFDRIAIQARNVLWRVLRSAVPGGDECLSEAGGCKVPANCGGQIGNVGSKGEGLTSDRERALC